MKMLIQTCEQWIISYKGSNEIVSNEEKVILSP